MIASIRRECLDHVIVMNEWHVGASSSYLDYKVDPVGAGRIVARPKSADSTIATSGTPPEWFWFAEFVASQGARLVCSLSQCVAGTRLTVSAAGN